MSHLLVHWVFANNAAPGITTIKCEGILELATAIQNPSAQGGFGETTVAQVLVAELLKSLV
jgi:hypothetical protein